MAEVDKTAIPEGEAVSSQAPPVAGTLTPSMVKVKMLKPRLVGSHNYQPGDEFEVDSAVAAEIQRAGDGIAEVKTINGQYIPPSDGVHVVDPRLIPPAAPLPAPEYPPPPSEKTGEVRTDPPRPAPNSGQPAPGQEKAIDYKDEPVKPAPPAGPKGQPSKNDPK